MSHIHSSDCTSSISWTIFSAGMLVDAMMISPCLSSFGPTRWLLSISLPYTRSSMFMCFINIFVISESESSSSPQSGIPWKRRLARHEYCSTSSVCAPRVTTLFSSSEMRCSFVATASSVLRLALTDGPVCLTIPGGIMSSSSSSLGFVRHTIVQSFF